VADEPQVVDPDEKYKKGPFYLWSPMRNGGETKVVHDPTGRERTVVSSRNILQPGEKVTKEKLTAESSDPDAQWKEYVDGGVVRNYPYPKDLTTASLESPVEHLQRTIREAATSEEERLSALVTTVGTTDENLVTAATEAEKASK